MPKRLLDSSLFASPSLARLSTRAQDAWPRLILVADDFGCFDANPRALVGLAWPLRSDVTEQDVEGWLGELVAAGMAQVWEQGGRRYCYLTGWNGPHGQRRREEYNRKTAPHGSKRRTPPPPPPPPARESGGPAAGNSKSRSKVVPARVPHLSRAVPASAGAVAGAETPQRQEASGGSGAVPSEPKAEPSLEPRPRKGPPTEEEFKADLDREAAEAERRKRRPRRPNGPAVSVSEAEVLARLPATVAEVSEALGHSAESALNPGPRAVAAAIRSLAQKGSVREVEMPGGVWGWERCQPAVTTTERDT